MIETKTLQKLALKATDMEDTFKAQEGTYCSIDLCVTSLGISMIIKSGTVRWTHVTPFGVIDDLPGRVLEIDLDEAMYRFMKIWLERPLTNLNLKNLEQVA